MSWLRRTGSGDLTPLHLDMDVDYTRQMWWRQLIPPGTSSPRTALISASRAGQTARRSARDDDDRRRPTPLSGATDREVAVAGSSGLP